MLSLLSHSLHVDTPSAHAGSAFIFFIFQLYQKMFALPFYCFSFRPVIWLKCCLYLLLKRCLLLCQLFAWIPAKISFPFFMIEFQLFIKGTIIQIWNLPIFLCSYKHINNMLKIFHSESEEFSSYLPAKFVHFLSNRLILKKFYCFLMFVNKLSTYLTCAYPQK